ncbi:GGDEF domain-containing protein [Herbaspirillum sp. ST 5-3]|uniref:sensor domain-containing diguanylate cyclase n=1 Tax=Oxalobacteraceae TaxID=75682 RepID=UPI0010A464EB|nr:GGDEF domain-containing protein [Herbaspirillum sp. ST 5-3]
MNIASNLILTEAKRCDLVQQADVVLEHLSAMAQEITTQLDPAAIFQALNLYLHELVSADSFLVYLLDPNTLSLNLAFGVDADKPLAPHRIALADSTSHAARCVRERRNLAIDAPRFGGQDHGLCSPTYSSALFFPLRVGNNVLGVMSIQSRQPHAFGDREQGIFQLLCAYGAIALDNAATHGQLKESLTILREAMDEKLELEHANQKLREASLTDSLTGLRNRRVLHEHLDGDIRACLRRYDKCLNDRSQGLPDEADLLFFMVDIDHFKEVNDNHGHAAGDRVLVQLAERLREVSRHSDYLVRWGGEEFLIVARSANRATAAQLAERIRTAVAGRDFVLGDGLKVAITCSVGFSCFPHLPTDPHLLSWIATVGLADQALYRAKIEGRNTCRDAYGATPELSVSVVRQAAPSCDTLNFHI